MASFVPRALVGGGVRIPLSAVPNPRVLKRNLTAQQWVMGEAETIDVPAYEVERAYITVPRAFGLHLIAEMGLGYDDARSDGAHRVYPKAIKHEGQYAYQESFVAQMVSAAARYGDFLAEAATGMGKTEMALSMIQRLGKTALIIVDQENLLTQWKERAKSSLGLTDKQIGIVQGSTCDYEGKHLVIAMMQSLSQRRYEVPLYDWPGIVVFDECHTAGAPTFSRVMLQFSARVRVGISATVDRKDALQKLIHWNLGEVRASLKQAHTRSYVYYVESQTVYSWYATISPKTGRIIEEVSSDPVRNRMLVEAILWLYETGRDTLVVSDRIEQLEALCSMVHYAGVPKEVTGLYCGYRTVWQYEKDPTPKRKPEGYEKGTEYTPVVLKACRKRVPKAELERVKNSAKVLFATYGMMAKGVDVPRLSGGIDCTHRTKAQQVHGRVLRHVEGKLVPVWITVRDVNCYRLEHQFLQRLDEYVEDNADIYQFDLANGAVRKESVSVLKKDTRENIKELKCLKTVAHADGGYALVSP